VAPRPPTALGETLKQAGLEHGLPTVPLLYDGIWDTDILNVLYEPTLNGDPLEGFVVRLADRFHYRDFRNCVGKYVRAEHMPRHGGELLLRNRLR
jgi:hypothetical protein